MSEQAQSYSIALKKFSHLQINRVMKENPSSDVVVISNNESQQKLVIIRSEFMERFNYSLDNRPEIAGEMLNQTWGLWFYNLTDDPHNPIDLASIHSEQQKFHIRPTLQSLPELAREIREAKDFINRIYVTVHPF